MKIGIAADTDQARRLELGEFLRAQRARLTPAMLGFDGGGRRRTPGLRREEVAQLCGLSTTWYTWLEQGRDISLSAHALGRLAVVLRLSAAERTFLFDLAGKRDPKAPGEAAPSAPSSLIAVLPRIDCPAYVLDHLWNAEGWNEAAARLFVGWLDAGRTERNLLRFIFLDPAARSLIDDWETRARRVLAEFRADYIRHIEDPAMQRLVADLVGGSELFARAWDAHAVVGREGGARGFRHPEDGLVRYRQLTFNPAGRPDLKLVMLTPEP
ncbi:helix-turn-helix transcriptional regulator [Labrys wisconsinensis]|uniref:Transcriptional regulator with XRE-family HTH domain n=1 Tax=Labrys wisconsinensis TaxID=425677 RepID=A0ABU0J1L1_9HYPH|nr:helix-turn-helix transcriptional regulator [Labrys wisconsinensis]MDQ0468140.1 transcriptional regulator with XRE-family HTH domain [Labrys wisconsinensis]